MSITTAAYSAVANTFQHISLNWDYTAGVVISEIFIDGVSFGTVALSGSYTWFEQVWGVLFGQDLTTYIDEISIYNIRLRTANFTAPTAQLVPYLATSPTAALTPQDSGVNDSTWDMSTILLFENPEVITTAGTLKYQFRADNTSGAGSYNGTWLTLAQLQASADPSGRYLQIQVQFNSDGTQRVSLGDGSVSVTQGVDTTAPPVPSDVTLSAPRAKTIRVSFTGTTDTGSGSVAGTDYYEVHIRATSTISDADVTAQTYQHELTIKHTGVATHTVDVETLPDAQTQLSDSTTYYVRVVAVDKLTNRSAGSTATSQATSGSTTPSTAITGHASSITATTITFYLSTWPSTVADGWAVEYRVRNTTTPAAWTRTSTNSSLAIGATIQLTGLTEDSTYECALVAMGGATVGPHGTLFVIVPNGAANTWDASEITEQIMSLIDDNLTASNRLGLTRKTQYGTLADYPTGRDQSARLPLAVVELGKVDTSYETFPNGHFVEYSYRIAYAAEFASTQAIRKARADKLGMLVGLFKDFPQLGFNGGRTTQGTVRYVHVEDASPTPPEDQFEKHGEIYAVGLTLIVMCRAYS
jgi:hypothetical protein